MHTKEVVILGAGPYGLSTAAYLQDAGVDAYVIGKPLAFWKQSMPGKMLLRSRIEASNIAAPKKHLSLAAYQKAIKRKLQEPLPIEDFIAYGDWFQKQVVPNLDERHVRHVSYNNNSFNITLDDGEEIHSKRLVLAVGIGLFSYRPEQFANIPKELAPHTSELSDLCKWRGKRVAVIGTGQSALEYAALLHESGAEVTILSRSSEVKFRPFAWRKHLFRTLTGGPLKGFSYKVFPPTDLGDIRTARKMANPEVFRQQPAEVQEKLLKDCTKPVGAYWLPQRLASVQVRTGVSVSRAEIERPGLKLHLTDGTTQRADLVVLATGYKVDISKYQILDVELRDRIEKTADKYPVLSMSLQTSIPGLYMAGVIAEKALGPTLRFVTGTSNAGPRLASSVTGRAISSSHNLAANNGHHEHS
jgi:FAD-dependent urate hydroxylase